MNLSLFEKKEKEPKPKDHPTISIASHPRGFHPGPRFQTTRDWQALQSSVEVSSHSTGLQARPVPKSWMDRFPRCWGDQFHGYLDNSNKICGISCISWPSPSTILLGEYEKSAGRHVIGSSLVDLFVSRIWTLIGDLPISKLTFANTCIIRLRHFLVVIAWCWFGHHQTTATNQLCHVFT